MASWWMSRSVGMLAGGVAVYVLLSATCLAAPTTPRLLAMFRSHTSLLWLVGPPVLLIYGQSLLWLYALGTAVFGAFVGTAVGVRNGSRWFCLLLTVMAIVTWVLSGLMVYVPSW